MICLFGMFVEKKDKSSDAIHPFQQKEQRMEETTLMFNSSKVKVTFDEEKVTDEDVKESLEKLGYAVIK